MNFFPWWPYFVGMAMLLATVSTRPFAGTETPPGHPAHRNIAIDGLRGFLAFGVFFGHSALYHQYKLDGTWAVKNASVLYTLLAQCAVALFFMITGYLFWGQLLATKGRPNWIALYTGRVFRIAPVYLTAIVGVVALVAVRTNFTLHEPSLNVLKQIMRWSLLGWEVGPDINGYTWTWMLLAGVTWTLWYEWRFYAALILIAPFARSARASLVAPIAAFIVVGGYLVLAPNPNQDPTITSCTLLFLAGMIIVSFDTMGYMIRLNKHVMSCAVLGLIALVWLACETAYTLLPTLLLSMIFWLISSGADLFGLLSCGPARRLGNVSFGIYLLQGLVLTVAFGSPSINQAAAASPLQHWLICLGCAVLLLCLASITHVVVELPGIAIGKWVLRRQTRAPAIV